MQLPGVSEYTVEEAERDKQRDREDRRWKPEFAKLPPKVNPYDQFAGEEPAQKMEQGEVPFGTRFKQHFINANRGGTGGIFEGLRMFLENDPVQKERYRNEAIALDQQFNNLPDSESLLDYSAAVGGSLTGGALDPASAVPIVRVGTVGWNMARPIVAPIINQMVSGAALNAVVNLADQGLETLNDMRDHVDLWDTAIQTAIGAGGGAFFGGLQGIGNKLRLDSARRVYEQETLKAGLEEAPEPGKAPLAPGFRREPPPTMEEMAGPERIAELQDQLFGGKGTTELTPDERNRLEDIILADNPQGIEQAPTETEGGVNLEVGPQTEFGQPQTEFGQAPEPVPLGRDLREFDPDELKIDAKRFQFKEGGDEAGVTERLKGVKKWDRTKAGLTLVWESKEGEFFIADGHQRVGLAKRLKAEGQEPKITGLILREADGVSADDARVIAAAKNIAEGTGNAIDAAKILRTRPEIGVDLPPASALVRDAQGLAKLSDDAFGMVVNRKVPAGYAALVGRLADDPKTHGELLSLLAKQEPGNAVEAESIIRDALEAPAVQQTMTDMFGTAETTQILYKERAQVLSAAASAIKKDRQAFSTLVKEKERISGAGNVLATESNVERAQLDAEILATLQAEARRKGPIGDALATAAKRLKDGEPRQAVVRDFIESVRQQAQKLGQGRRGRGAPGQPEQVAASIGGRRTDSPAFKKWFGDSKVVDENGEPLVVYHGTAKPFSKVDMRKGIFWVTSNREAIEKGEVGAAGRGHIMELYAKIEKPAGWKEYDQLSLGEIEGRGFDGVILPNKDGTFDAIVFEPTQIKSIFNRGTWDAQEPNIAFSARGRQSRGPGLFDVTQQTAQQGGGRPQGVAGAKTDAGSALPLAGGTSLSQAQRAANAPLKGKVAQKPLEFGLFGDDDKQLDLVDLARIAPKVVADAENVDLSPGAHTVRLGNSSITYNVMPDRVEVIAVRTPPDARRQGAARAAMTAFLDRMDEEGLDVVTVARPLDQATHQEGVTNLYRAFGFEETGRAVGESPEMVRQPQFNALTEIKKMIQANAPIEQIAGHPFIVDSIRRMEEIPRTHEQPGYGENEYWEARKFIFGTEEVTGLDNAVDRLVQGAKDFATKGLGNDAQATIILGPAAAGKSTIAEKLAVSRKAAIVDPDEAKKVLPEYQNGLGANATHEESSDIGAEVLGRLIDEKANIILPKVGANEKGIGKLIEDLKGEGYSVAVVNLRVSYENAFRRMINRFMSTGRLIDPKYVEFVGEKPAQTYRALRERGVADGYAEIDGDLPKGQIGIIEDTGVEGISRLGSDRGRGVREDVRPPEDLQAIAAKGRVQPQGLPPTNRPQAGTASVDQRQAEQLEAIGADLKALVGFPVRQGRLHKPRGLPKGSVVQGQFDRQQGVVRLREMADFETQTHEAAHAMETQYGQGLNAVKLAHRAELEPMAYPGVPAAQQLSEGFAEWLRFYVTTPLYAQRQAPNFTTAFESYMGQRAPDVLKGLADVSKRFVEWTRTPSRAAVSADIVSQRKGSSLTEAVSEMRREGWRTGLGRYFDKTYTGMLDKLHPINVAVDELKKVYEKNTGQGLDIKGADNPYVRARIAQDAYSSGHVDLMHGVVPYRGTMSEGPGLADALSIALGDQWQSWDDALVQDFGAYLVARRALQEYRRWAAGEIPNPPGKFTEGDYQVARDEFEAAHPEWDHAASLVYEWQRNLLKKKFEAGFITSELYQELQARADYVPMLRDMTNLGEEAVNVGQAGGKTLRQSIIKAFQGSKRAVLNPLETMTQDAYRTASLIQRNDVFKALDDLGQMAGPGSGAIVERIPSSQMKGTTIDVNEALRNAAKEAGVPDQDIDALTSLVDDLMGENASATIFRAGEINERGEPIVYAWRNGKKQALRLADGEFGREMYQALTGMSEEMRNIFINVAALPSTVLRYGITTHPPFLLANYLRDQLSAWIITGNNFVPFISGARGTFDELIQGDITRIYNTAMGIMGGGQTAALDKARAMRDIRALSKKGYAVKRFASVRGFAELTEITETGTRLAVFRNAFNRAKKEGLTDFEAMIEASFTSRDYIDFGRHGSHMYAARRLVPFLNAALQGLDKTVRTLTAEGALRKAITPYVTFRAGRPLSAADKKNLGKAASAFAKMQAIALFGLGLSYIYRDDPEYEELSDYLRATHWMVKLGPGNWAAIPKPFDLAFFSNLYERSFESTYGKDEIAMQKFLTGLWDISVPPTEIPLVQTYYEMKTNQRMDTGRPIVPENLEGLDPALQYNAYTSWVAKKIGELTNTSPMMIDHAIAGFGGSWGRSISDASRDIEQGRGLATSVADTMKRRFIRDSTRGATSSRAFWDQIGRDGGRMSQVAESYANLVKNSPGDAARYLEGKTDNEVAYSILNAHGDADAKRLHPMRRAKDAIQAISSMRRQLAADNLIMIESDPEEPEKIILTPSQRQAAQDILAKLEMVEARNALITVGQPGWKQRDYIDSESLKQDIQTMLPEVAEELLLRYEKNQVYDDEAVRESWAEVKDRALQDREEATFDDLVAGVK